MAAFAIPPCTLNEKAVDHDTVLRLRIDLVGTLGFLDFEGEAELVDGDLVLAGVGLQDTSEEALGEEHVGQAVGGWVAVLQPVFHEGHSFDEVGVPGAEGLEGWIGYFLPVEGLLVVLDSEVHLVQLVAHDDETFDGEVDFCEGSLHLCEQSVEFLHFLNQDS